MTQIQAEEGEETSQRREVAETFPIPGREEVCEGREGQSHSGSGWVLLAGVALPGKTTGRVENKEGGENGCFQFTGKGTQPFYQTNNEA